MKSNKIMITCALCGGGTTRKQSPYLPLSPEELAADAVKAVKAGACILHIHARDEEGKNTMEPNRFVEVVETIRAALRAENLAAIINVTSSGAAFSEDWRLAHLPILMPEMCSYDPGTLNWGNATVFLNTPAFLERLGKLTQELDIKPEIEIFDAGMLGNVEYYLKKGILKGPLHYQLVLDVPGGMPGDQKTVQVVDFGGRRRIFGFNNKADCYLDGFAAPETDSETYTAMRKANMKLAAEHAHDQK